MVTRILGICTGVLLSLLVSVFVFPRSASQVSWNLMSLSRAGCLQRRLS